MNIGINELKNAYDTTVGRLHPIISYGFSETADTQQIENDVRLVLEAVQEQTEKITTELSAKQQDADEILRNIQEVAALQGVSQQAIYFKDESDSHVKNSNTWQWVTLGWGIILGVYAIVLICFQEWFQASTMPESIQLAVSKVLLFVVISYMLFLSARNFLSHKHNAIINKHRQNALVTYKALVDAAQTEPIKDIVLAHASACIFLPQDTGYTKPTTSNSSTISDRAIVGLIPGAISKIDGQG